jgi:hypothetical protein
MGNTQQAPLTVDMSAFKPFAPADTSAPVTVDMSAFKPFADAAAPAPAQMDLKTGAGGMEAAAQQGTDAQVAKMRPTAGYRFGTTMGNVGDAATGAVKGLFQPPQSVREEHIANMTAGATGTPFGELSPVVPLAAYRVAKGLVDSAERMFKAKSAQDYNQSREAFKQAVIDFHNGHYGDAALGDLEAVTGMAGNPDDLKTQLARGAKSGGDLASPLGTLAGQGIVTGGTAIAGGALGDVAAGLGDTAEAEEVAEANAAPKLPGAIRRRISPTAATQPAAQSTLRAGASAAADEAGVAGEHTVGVRTLMDKGIANASNAEQSLYDNVNAAAKTDMKSLYDQQEELQDAISDPTNIGQKTALQKELTANQKLIADGEANVQAKLGTDASKLIQDAKSATKQRYAMEDVAKKIFNNESVVAGNVEHGADETINVNSAIKQAENLAKPSKFAPRGTPTRLQQALGEDGAKAFKEGLYSAQKAGQTVVRRNQIFKWLIGIGALGGGAEIVKNVL